MNKIIKTISITLIVLLFLCIPTLFILENYRVEERYYANIVGSQLSLVAGQDQKEIIFANSLILPIKAISLEAEEAILKIPGFIVDPSKTDIQELNDKQTGGELIIKLPTSPDQSKPNIEISLEDDETKISNIAIRLKKGETLNYSTERINNNLVLSITPSTALLELNFSITGVGLSAEECMMDYETIKDYKLSQHKHESVRISGKIKNGPGTARFKLGIIRSFKIYLKEKIVKNKLVKFNEKIYFEGIPVEKLVNPSITNAISGFINIHKNKYIDIKKSYLTGSSISFSNTLNDKTEIQIGSEGMNIGIQSNSSELKINDVDQTSSYLDLLLSHKALTISIAFIILIIDKWLLIWLQKSSDESSSNNLTEINERILKIENWMNIKKD